MLFYSKSSISSRRNCHKQVAFSSTEGSKINLTTVLAFDKVLGIEETYLDVVGNPKSRKKVLAIDFCSWRMKMTNDLKSVLPTPTKRRFAATFRLVRPISFWVQLALGFVSGLALFLAITSRNLTVQVAANPLMSSGVLLGVVGIAVLGFRLYWTFRYRRLAKLLQSPDRTLQPSRAAVIQVLQIGLIVSLVGLVLAFLASELTLAVVVAKVVAIPPGIAAYPPTNFIRPLDIFVVLANVTLIGAHLVGSITSLGLINWLED